MGGARGLRLYRGMGVGGTAMGKRVGPTETERGQQPQQDTPRTVGTITAWP